MEDFITIIERGLHVINHDGMKAESWQALRDEREEEEERREPAELRLAGAGSPVIRNMRHGSRNETSLFPFTVEANKRAEKCSRLCRRSGDKVQDRLAVELLSPGCKPPLLC